MQYSSIITEPVRISMGNVTPRGSSLQNRDRVSKEISFGHIDKDDHLQCICNEKGRLDTIPSDGVHVESNDRKGISSQGVTL